MSISAHAPLETEVPVFDVVVTMATGVTTADVERLALQYGELSKGQMEGLLRAFQNGPRVKVGDHVPKERADKAKEQFGKLGLIVTVVPMLSLQTKIEGDFDGRFLCRACDNRVDLPTNRQCPSCGMFVDKITDEWLLKKKIMEQERAKLDSQINRDDKSMKKANQKSLEDAIRAKIREELEEEYGIKKDGGLFSGKPGLMRVAGVVGLVAAAFVGGGILPAGAMPWNKSAQTSSAFKGPATADVDKMLSNVGAADASGATGDPDIDDPSIQALAGGKKMGGPGLTMEQAIAASRSLAASVGNTTFDQATGGGNSAVVGGASKAGAASAPDATAVDSAPITIAPLIKHVLAGDFARELAELSQWRRARAVVKSVKPLAVDPAAVMSLQGADLEAQAWAIHPLSDTKARQAMDLLIADSKQIADAAGRARALGAVAVIVSQHVQLPPDAARAFLTLSAESLKTVGDAKVRGAAMGDWMVSMGQVLLQEATTHVKAGRLPKAQVTADQLAALIKDAADASAQARLHALNYQMRLAMGHPDTAGQSLSAAMTAAGNVPGIVERAALLRTLSHLLGSVNLEPLQGAVGALRAQLESKSALNKEHAYAHLSLMYADYGVRDRADENGRLALTTKGMTAIESSALQADLITRGDMATAKLLHLAGRYSESEVVLQRLSGYLF
jgi:tetratricopeptide (TPR) repeat protein